MTTKVGRFHKKLKIVKIPKIGFNIDHILYFLNLLGGVFTF